MQNLLSTYTPNIFKKHIKYYHTYIFYFFQNNLVIQKWHQCKTEKFDRAFCKVLIIFYKPTRFITHWIFNIKIFFLNLILNVTQKFVNISNNILKKTTCQNISHSFQGCHKTIKSISYIIFMCLAFLRPIYVLFVFTRYASMSSHCIRAYALLKNNN